MNEHPGASLEVGTVGEMIASAVHRYPERIAFLDGPHRITYLNGNALQLVASDSNEFSIRSPKSQIRNR